MPVFDIALETSSLDAPQCTVVQLSASTPATHSRLCWIDDNLILWHGPHLGLSKIAITLVPLVFKFIYAATAHSRQNSEKRQLF